MKKITQRKIAKYLGVSENFVCLFRKNKRLFSKQRAKSLSVDTGVDFDLLAFTGGEVAYRAIVEAYSNKIENI